MAVLCRANALKYAQSGSLSTPKPRLRRARESAFMATDRQLADVLSEFARTLTTDFPIQGILDHLVRRIVDILPISGAGVTLISPTTAPHDVAASDEAALGYERLQTEVGEGPC